MKYPCIENSSEIGGYVINPDSITMNLVDRKIDIPLVNCHFKDNKLFYVKPTVMLERGEAVSINRYHFWIE
jgi:hypothetical protein